MALQESSSGFRAGFELHVSLNTESKLFCGCSVAEKTAAPNSSCCEICLGFPGSKPLANRKAIEYALKLALALNCKIAPEMRFSRKVYSYPDLAKNFQISQFEVPLGENGFVLLDSAKKIRIKRVHLEEDPAAIVHEGSVASASSCLVDYNRSGVPLVEIVTEPDISSAGEAREFFSKIRSIIFYLDIFDERKSVIKADTNISVDGGNRVEVKNVTGIKNIEKVLGFEVERQKTAVKAGTGVKRETRGFDEVTSSTFSLREKETEDDYGYIIEPDLTKIVLEKKLVKEVRDSLPELPEEKVKRLKKEFKLSEYNARVMASDPELGKLFESAAKEVGAELAAKFLSRELLGILNYNDLSLRELSLSSKEIISLLKLLEQEKVSEKNAKEATIKYVLEGIPPLKFLKGEQLLSDVPDDTLIKTVEKVMKENPKAISDLRKGEKKAMNFLVGIAMREMKGKAEARKVQELIKEKLK